jgi:hypothetical protein
VAFVKAWLDFRRTQDCACIAAGLIYAAAALHAWTRLPGPAALKTEVILAFPAAFLIATIVVSLGVGAIRRSLARYVWMSFEAGFGQSAMSILMGVSLLIAAAVLIYLEVGHAAAGGRYPAGVFSGYGAGIGILIVQAALVRTLQRDPAIRSQIER